MKLYLENGYLNVPYIYERGYPFTLVCGGRGTGKTFGALAMCRTQGIKFIYLRRTQAQADLVMKQDYSPFKSVDRVLGTYTVTTTINKYTGGFYSVEMDEDGLAKPTGAPIGYIMALSTFSNMRGFDASDVQLIIYDEFIPERHERPIKNEFDALMNCYETVNRNRELDGLPPCKLLALSNSNNMSNPLFMGMGLVQRAVKMQEKSVEMFEDQKRGVALYMLAHSPISEKKAKTAVYRLTEGSDFARMSLGNEFTKDVPSRTESRPLGEYKPIVTVGDVTIYRHKSAAEFYVSMHRRGDPAVYSDSETDLMRFRRTYGWLWERYLSNLIIFENYTCEILLTKYLT